MVDVRVDQGCGLDRDVSVSRRSRGVLTYCLAFISDKILNVSGLVSVSEQHVSVSAQ